MSVAVVRPDHLRDPAPRRFAQLLVGRHRNEHPIRPHRVERRIDLRRACQSIQISKTWHAAVGRRECPGNGSRTQPGSASPFLRSPTPQTHGATHPRGHNIASGLHCEISAKLCCKPASLQLTNGPEGAIMLDSDSLRKRRETLCLTREDLARRSGVCATTIMRIENGKDPRLSTWRKLMAALPIKNSIAERQVPTAT